MTMRARGLDADDSTYREAMKRCAIANDPTQVTLSLQDLHGRQVLYSYIIRRTEV